VGLALTVPFYATVVALSFSLFRDSRSPVFVAAGGTCLALVLALLFGAIGSQTFYPREGAVGMWAAIGLMLRTAVERWQAVRLARGAGRGDTPIAAHTPRPDTPPGEAPFQEVAPSSNWRKVSIDALLWARRARHLAAHERPGRESGWNRHLGSV